MFRNELKDTFFGLELEFTGITREEAAKIIAKTLKTNNYYTENEYSTNYNAEDRQSRIWEIKYDGSINTTYSDRRRCFDDEYSVELATPKLTLKDMPILLKTINNLHKAGAVANESCGIHIHVDSSKQTPESLEYLLEQMFLNQDMLFSAVKVNPKREDYCSELTPELICEIEEDKVETLDELQENYENEKFFHKDQNCGSRYRNLNLENSFHHNKKRNHLEYRFFNSTFKTPLIRAYIKFCLTFSQSGIDKVQNLEAEHLSKPMKAIKRLLWKILPIKAITLRHLKKIDSRNHNRRIKDDYDKRELELYLKQLNMNRTERRLLADGLKLHPEREDITFEPETI